MKQKRSIAAGKTTVKGESRTKVPGSTFLGVTILKPHFKPNGTTVKKIRAAVRAANGQNSPT
ncbi:MAG: hypothetical protein SH859_14715 [Hyphomicrobium aestuarii]|nr:hypothetical protein [Hyphomicrobium aestuarii]